MSGFIGSATMQSLKSCAIAAVGAIALGGLGVSSATAADIPAQPRPYYQGENYGPAPQPVYPANPYAAPPVVYYAPPPAPEVVVVPPGPYYTYGGVWPYRRYYGPYAYAPFARGYGHHWHRAHARW